MTDIVGEDEDTAGFTGDEQVIREARSRFRRAMAWEAETRTRAASDLKFVNGDPDNGWQWPDDVRNDREVQRKPYLTLNKTRVHCLQIENEARKNKPSVNIRPTGNGATYEAAQVFEGIVRHIEYISRAQNAYMTASRFQIRTGIGYWRVVTDHLGPETFDQEIYIRRVKDPTTILLDPDINEEDGSDARFGFVFDDMPKDEFRSKYPEHKEISAGAALGGADDAAWLAEDHVRVVEYFRVLPKKDKLVRARNPQTGEMQTIRLSKFPKEGLEQIKDSLDYKEREIIENKIEWFTIAGEKVLDKRDWPGIYVPIVRAVGEETIVEKQLDRKGHVRPMKDAQRQYNYWASATTESVALQPKSPWILDPASIEGNEAVWAKSNVSNPAFLPWKSWDDEGGRAYPTPERVAPPNLPEALIKGMEIAQQEMMMVTGQYQAQLGENENAKSGRAIQERQAQGDNATYHFNDGLATAIRFTGKILIDLIPKIYDTPRIIKIMAEDDSEEEVQIDPQAQQAYFSKQAAEGQAVRSIFNPNVGTYDVEADIGPDYATKRQEAYNALTQLMAANKDLVTIAGDLLMKVCDFPMADELAKRLKRMVPPQALGEAPPPQLQAQMAQLQQQNQNLMHIVAELTKKAAEDAIKIRGKDEQKDIDVYDSHTRRITAISNAQPELGDNDIKPVVDETLQTMLNDNLSAIVTANAPTIDMMNSGSQ
jgi:Txe/YoeB family toxin of Txe-Axe toxin-antitoxin module